MQISPISLYSMRNNNVQNVKSNKPSFGSGYGMVSGSDAPGWAEMYTFGSPRVNCAGLSLRTNQLYSLGIINEQLKTISPEKQREFLMDAVEEKTQGRVFRHISYTLKEASKNDNSKEEFKTIFDAALDAQYRKEGKKDLAANNANLIEWFIDCLPENSREDYLAKQEKFIAQARQDLKQPTWKPNPEAKVINL